MNNRELNERLRRANPIPTPEQTDPKRKSGRTAFATVAKGMVAVFTILVLGVGVTWAATGKNPVTSMFGQDFVVNESPVGLQDLSVLRPSSPEDLEGLSEESQMMALSVTMRATDLSRSLKRRMADLGPARISAIGNGRTNEGTGFTMLVIDNEICLLSNPGWGGCGSLSSIVDGKHFGGYGQNNGLSRLAGIVPDEVAAIQIAGSNEPPIPVPDNVYEIKDLPAKDLSIIGLNEAGEELFKTGIPMSFYGSP